MLWLRVSMPMSNPMHMCTHFVVTQMILSPDSRVDATKIRMQVEHGCTQFPFACGMDLHFDYQAIAGHRSASLLRGTSHNRLEQILRGFPQMTHTSNLHSPRLST